MIILAFALTIVLFVKQSHSVSCDTKCPVENEMVCGFDSVNTKYKMFPGHCALQRYQACTNIDLIITQKYYCIKNEETSSNRRQYTDQPCPTFCPSHYRPVCGVSKINSFNYRSFTNGCQMDMLNCRGYDESSGYVEVPLGFCPRHMFRNIFKDQILF